VLEVLGLVRTATGSGPTAGAIIVATPRGGMSALMRLQVAAQGFAVADVVKTRLVLEASVASDLAAASATADVRADVSLPASGIPFSRSGPQNAAVTARTGSGLAGVTDRLAPARQLLDAMDSPDLTAAEFLALDAQFHVSLAEASGNQVVAAMMAGLRNAIESYVLSASATLTSWPTTSARLRAEHRGILASIDDRDAVDAVTRVRAHITGYYAQSQLAPAATLAPASAATPTPTSPAHDRH
jgi:DNA-binding FadR family transcriptional regulator